MVYEDGKFVYLAYGATRFGTRELRFEAHVARDLGHRLIAAADRMLPAPPSGAERTDTE